MVVEEKHISIAERIKKDYCLNYLETISLENKVSESQYALHPSGDHCFCSDDRRQILRFDQKGQLVVKNNLPNSLSVISFGIDSEEQIHVFADASSGEKVRVVFDAGFQIVSEEVVASKSLLFKRCFNGDFIVSDYFAASYQDSLGGAWEGIPSMLTKNTGIQTGFSLDTYFLGLNGIDRDSYGRTFFSLEVRSKDLQEVLGYFIGSLENAKANSFCYQETKRYAYALSVVEDHVWLLGTDASLTKLDRELNPVFFSGALRDKEKLISSTRFVLKPQEKDSESEVFLLSDKANEIYRFQI